MIFILISNVSVLILPFKYYNFFLQKAEVDKLFGSIKLKLEQSERRTQEAEQRLQEQIQGQATVEQEAQRVVQARADLEEVRKEFDVAKTENLVILNL